MRSVVQIGANGKGGRKAGATAAEAQPLAIDARAELIILPADGMWYLCLYSSQGIDLKSLLRSGASKDAIASLITSAWQLRADRGAEDRLAVQNRDSFIPVSTLRKDYHLEMHTRGG